MITSEQQLPAELAEIQHVLQGSRGSIRPTYVFGRGTCVQVYEGSRKVGPVIIPEDNQTLGEVLHMLGDLIQPQTKAERDKEAQVAQA